MWVLECDGDLLQGRKKWLKPGQNYLFGRTRDASGEQSYAIEHKSVSRKHLVITVAPVPPGQGNNLYEKSALSISDNSKFGTYLDGERFTNETRVLSEKQHEIKLGSYNQIFRISWRPVVITFAQSKGIAPSRDRLEPFDIKANVTYLALDTSYVVTAKRNVALSLQALINAKNIVTEAFVDALVVVCQSSGLAEDGSSPLSSPLEEDMDANWPEPLSFLPPPGKEPNPRSADAFAPNRDRIDVFEGFTFIFGDQKQFETLSPVVMNGGAKAVLFDLRPGQTPIEDFVKFVHQIAAQKGIKDLANNETNNKVVVVRFALKGEHERWSSEFLQNLDLQLGQRSVEQNEFLDAILMNDARPLHRYLLDEDAPQPTPAPTSEQPASRIQHSGGLEQQVDVNEEQAASPKPTAEPEAPSRKARVRRVAESKFKGFDDFDPSQIIHDSLGEEPAPAQEATDLRDDGHEMQVDSNPIFFDDSRPNTRANKRRHSSVSYTAERTEEDMVAALLPAAAAMKRRRLGENNANTANFNVNDSARAVKASDDKAKRSEPQIDVRSAARSHAEQLNKEQSAKLSLPGHEGDEDPYQNEDITKLRNLALVEDMEVPVRRMHSQHNSRGANERWDDRWNGMQNFKKFRRRGADGVAEPPGNRGRQVLVGLVEAKRKDYGIGENYWFEPVESVSSRRRREPPAPSTAVAGSAQGQEQQSIEPAPGGRNKGPRGEIGEQQDEVLPEMGGPSREQSVAEGYGDQSRAAAATQATAKRAGPGASASAAKRQRGTGTAGASRAVSVVQVEESSSDDDELKFRSRRRRG